MDAGRVPDHLAERWAAQDWPAIRLQMMAYAVYLSRSAHAAEDLVQEALSRTMDPEGDLWDPDAEPQLAKHLMRIIEKIHRSERDKRDVRRDPLNVRAAREKLKPVIPTPEHAVLEAEREAEGRACIEDLKRRVAANWLDVELVELADQGIDKAAKQAEILKRSIVEIRNARKRIDRAIDAVLQQRRDAGSEGSRKRLAP
jgi:DNA-directed RNA polymerase specialized sigma24 family protein